ncbi:MAG: AmmeMemoRadiSam system radical SAM enzyme [Candidatus Omnitrophica bacterium]|nr:AmmeMemoRadiSam system radical SAM enzyme [Candidatus Omnitrophota bacterium]MCM8791199.1 AmmeMemoRadiSam system radical SAM enzyme [Candidatus Omnitrophota bacterium]
MKEALYYERIDSHTHCHLCPNECVIPNGGRGSCGVRINRNSVLYSEIYGRTTSIALDPIEKKPLYHYHPGKYILSLGTKGCNMHCDFCQNWHISQDLKVPTENITPTQIVEKAKEVGSFGIAYTYNEPFIWYEFVLDTAKLARKNGLENVLVTNGYVNMAPLEGMLPYIGAMNIDLKSFNEDFYAKICKARLKPVLDVIKRSVKSCHVELTTLLIPSLNDSEDEIEKEVDWIYENLGPEIPLHFSRYFPCYKMSLRPTPIRTLERAAEIARRKLRYVYLGNV